MRVRKRVITLGLCLGLCVSQLMIYHANKSYAYTFDEYSEGTDYTYNLRPRTYNNPSSNYTKPEKINPSEIYANNVDSMAYIETNKGSGSGIFIKEDGTLLTCFHVIADADWIKVTLNNGSGYYVNGFRYINPLEDIAILTLDTTDKFKPIKISHSTPKVGEKIYTISNPQGLHFAFSDGMVSQITPDYLQFSAPISQGSSGGALLNEQGELTGVITSTYKDSQNINFALPNSYYTSKFNNQPIVNWYGNAINFSIFIANNADKDQFKIYTENAMNSRNFEQLYYLMKLLSKRSDFPTDAYAMMAYIAFMNFELDETRYWCGLSLKEKKNMEGSLVLGLLASIMLQDDKSLQMSKEALLYLYPETYYIVEKIMKSVIDCNYDKECELYAFQKLMYEIEDLVKFDNYRMIFY